MASPHLFFLDQVWKEQPGPNGQVQPILRGVTVAILASGVTCVAGPSGAGKSTLLRLLNRLEDPTRGQIRFRGLDITQLNPLELRRRVGMVMQQPVMLPGTVAENLAAGLRLQGRTLANPGAWLQRVGLSPGLLDRSAQDLSGGEKQRVALARTLVTEPEALLLDEITASLDPESTTTIETVITGLDLPVIWVSHDPAQISRVASRVLRLEQGQLQEVQP